MFDVAVILAWLGKGNQLPGFVVSRSASLSTTLKIGAVVVCFFKQYAAKHCRVNSVQDVYPETRKQTRNY